VTTESRTLTELELALVSGEPLRIRESAAAAQHIGVTREAVDRIASILGFLTVSFMDARGTDLSALSDRELVQSVIAGLKVDGRLDRQTKRSVRRAAPRMIRGWASLDGAWLGGTEIAWAMTLTVSFVDALRRRVDYDELATRDRWAGAVGLDPLGPAD
jgi:hypothetical protein